MPKSETSRYYRKIGGNYYSPMAFKPTKAEAKKYAKKIKEVHKDSIDPLHKSVRILETPKKSKRRKEGLRYGVWLGSYHTKADIIKDHPDIFK